MLVRHSERLGFWLPKRKRYEHGILGFRGLSKWSLPAKKLGSLWGYRTTDPPAIYHHSGLSPNRLISFSNQANQIRSVILGKHSSLVAIVPLSLLCPCNADVHSSTLSLFFPHFQFNIFSNTLPYPVKRCPHCMTQDSSAFSSLHCLFGFSSQLAVVMGPVKGEEDLCSFEVAAGPSCLRRRDLLRNGGGCGKDSASDLVIFWQQQWGTMSHHNYDPVLQEITT